MVQFDEEKQKLALAELREKEEEEFVKIAASNRGLQYFNLTNVPLETDALKLVPEAQATEAQFVPFQLLDRRLGVAVVDPDSQKTLALVETLTRAGYSVQLFLVSHKSLSRALLKYKELSLIKSEKTGAFDISDEEISDVLASVKTTADIKKYVSDRLAQKNYKTTKILEVILAGALAVHASDIHIEPEEEKVRLRYRLDGVLNDMLDFNHDLYHYLISRIKLISGLKLNVSAEAQDGRFSIHAKNADIEIRTSTLPGAYGESVVMRILDPDTISVTMESLGFEPNLQKILEHEITKPNGMILTTGPTGSGKTTTLYAFLRKVYAPEIKVVTIENPIEYHLQGIVQTQTNEEKGYTFNLGLRAVLRQDPDIIMVGEIRDAETAETAVSAAVTGHLVFSTLHTNNAAGTFPRLLSFGINPKVISSSVTVALAQRLVRKLCPKCKKEKLLEGEDKALAEKVIGSITRSEYKSLQQKNIWDAVGCKECNMTGFKGRIGIFEAILMNQKIETAVLNNPSEREIEAAAKDQGILTMPQDGMVKVLRGVTSLGELRRVVNMGEGV